jgi:DNA adenine methylase
MRHTQLDRLTGRQLQKSPLKLIGAKSRIRGWLYQFFPEHETYIEPFLGSGTVLIGKPPAAGEIASDLNYYVINFFKVLQDNPEEFWSQYLSYKAILLVWGKGQFEHLKKIVVKTNDPVIKAVAFYLITKVCMNGIWRLNKAGECNSSYCGQTTGRGFMDREFFDAVLERIKDVNFIHINAKIAVTSSIFLPDQDKMFMFLDPPYRYTGKIKENKGCVTTYNGLRFTEQDHIDLESYLRQLSCKWLMTINDDEVIRELYKDYDIIPHDVRYCASQTPAGRGLRPELLVANYDITSRRQDKV